jgi:hypothetical protein
MSPPVMARRAGRESVGGAREGWDSEFGEDGGVVLVVYGGAVVGQREQRDDLDAGAGHGRDAGEHLLDAGSTCRSIARPRHG